MPLRLLPQRQIATRAARFAGGGGCCRGSGEVDAAECGGRRADRASGQADRTLLAHRDVGTRLGEHVALAVETD
eukprot:6897367-Prymnesium_polylepis.1